MTSAPVTLPALQLCLARSQLLLLSPKQLVQKMVESTWSASAFASSSSFSSTALAALGLKSWHECGDVLHSLSIFIGVRITVSVNISSTILESTLKPALAASHKSQ